METAPSVEIKAHEQAHSAKPLIMLRKLTGYSTGSIPSSERQS